MRGLLEGMFKAKDKADKELREAQKEMIEKQYQRDMEKRHDEHLRTHNMYAQAIAKQEGGLIQGASGYGYGWNDPRVQLGRQNPVPTPSLEELHQNVAQANQMMKEMFSKMQRTERKVAQLSGFYHWITEVHPELTAQYKAMRELYDAANNTNDVEKEA